MLIEEAAPYISKILNIKRKWKCVYASFLALRSFFVRGAVILSWDSRYVAIWYFTNQQSRYLAILSKISDNWLQYCVMVVEISLLIICEITLVDLIFILVISLKKEPLTFQSELVDELYVFMANGFALKLIFN